MVVSLIDWWICAGCEDSDRIISINGQLRNAGVGLLHRDSKIGVYNGTCVAANSCVTANNNARATDESHQADEYC
jgi:hypothetical protein